MLVAFPKTFPGCFQMNPQQFGHWQTMQVERAIWQLAVQVGSQSISPLFWSLRSPTEFAEALGASRASGNIWNQIFKRPRKNIFHTCSIGHETAGLHQEFKKAIDDVNQIKQIRNPDNQKRRRQTKTKIKRYETALQT
jgi:hypothetical protein